MPGMDVKMEIRGNKELNRKLQEQIKELSRPEAMMGKAVMAAQGEIKVATPVDTGRLRSSIFPLVSEGGRLGKVYTNVVYASYVEYGTKRMKSRHVTRGSSVRVKGGPGPFEFGLSQAREKIQKILHELGETLKGKWGR